MEYAIGQLVYSKKGRDKGKPFIVVDIDGEFLFLVDGVLRTFEKPKKKKIKHVQTSKTVFKEIQNKIVNKIHLLNKDFENLLKIYSDTKQ